MDLFGTIFYNVEDKLIVHNIEASKTQIVVSTFISFLTFGTKRKSHLVLGKCRDYFFEGEIIVNGEFIFYRQVVCKFNLNDNNAIMNNVLNLIFD